MTKSQNTRGNSGWWFGASAVGLLLVLIWFVLNLGYGKISSTGSEYALAMFSACNRHDGKHLERIMEQMEEAVSSGELSDADMRVLKSIADQAQAGRWQRATSQLRSLMEAQIEQGNPHAPAS